MIIRVGSETNFFHLRDFGFRFHFLFLLLLVVKEFIIIDDLTYGRICLWRYFNQVKRLLLCDLQCFLHWIYSNCYIIANKSHLGNTNKMIDTMFRFFTWREPSSESTFTKTPGFIES